jgi:hypothetical protein
MDILQSNVSLGHITLLIYKKKITFLILGNGGFFLNEWFCRDDRGMVSSGKTDKKERIL